MSEIRSTVKVKVDRHPELYRDLEKVDDKGRAERIRMLATSYLLMIENGVEMTHKTNSVSENEISEQESESKEDLIKSFSSSLMGPP